MKTILVAGGCRPEWIKLASTVKELYKKYRVILVNTGQHTTMSDSILKDLKLNPTYNFNTMGYPVTEILSRSIMNITRVIETEKPSLIVVQGDTISTLAGAMTGFYNNIPVAHLESGSRSKRINEPFPEEMNRRLVDKLSTYHYCMCEEHNNNLRVEGIHTGVVAGNTTLDAIALMKTQTVMKRKQVVITAHRRENWNNYDGLCKAVKELAEKNKQFKFVFVMHANPVLQKKVFNILSGLDNVELKQPLGYREFLFELSKTMILLTDSGGTSQEAPSFKIPVVMLRTVCENKLLLDKHLAVLVGMDRKKIVLETEKLIKEKSHYNSMIGENPYGDGTAGITIAEHIFKTIGE